MNKELRKIAQEIRVIKSQLEKMSGSKEPNYKRFNADFSVEMSKTPEWRSYIKWLDNYHNNLIKEIKSDIAAGNAGDEEMQEEVDYYLDSLSLSERDAGHRDRDPVVSKAWNSLEDQFGTEEFDHFFADFTAWEEDSYYASLVKEMERLIKWR